MFLAQNTNAMNCKRPEKVLKTHAEYLGQDRAGRGWESDLTSKTVFFVAHSILVLSKGVTTTKTMQSVRSLSTKLRFLFCFILMTHKGSHEVYRGSNPVMTLIEGWVMGCLDHRSTRISNPA